MCSQHLLIRSSSSDGLETLSSLSSSLFCSACVFIPFFSSPFLSFRTARSLVPLFHDDRTALSESTPFNSLRTSLPFNFPPKPTVPTPVDRFNTGIAIPPIIDSFTVNPDWIGRYRRLSTALLFELHRPAILFYIYLPFPASPRAPLRRALTTQPPPFLTWISSNTIRSDLPSPKRFHSFLRPVYPLALDAASRE